MKQKSQAILVAGMHRSGTSLSTNLLRDSGLFVGEDLMDGGFDNKKGHFEDYEFVKIHENDLKIKGLETTGLKHINDIDLEFEQESLLTIQDLLEKRSQHALWGWKDPRSTLYMLAWKRLIPNLKVIAIYRDAEEVVNSLMRRYKYKIDHQVNYSRFKRQLHLFGYPVYSEYLKYSHYKSWVIHNQNILKFKELYPDDIVIYELNEFLSTYDKKIASINTNFDIKLNPVNVDKVFNSNEMKHKTDNGLSFFNKTKLNSIKEQLIAVSSE